MAVNNQTLGQAKLYTDQKLASHVDAADPHPQYAELVYSTGEPTGGRLIFLQAGDPLPPVVRAGSVVFAPGPTPVAGVYVANQAATAWVRLATGQPAVDTTPPTVPGGIRSSAVGTTGFTITWDASTDTETGVARYEVALGASAAFASNGAALTKTFTGLTAGTGYTVRVRAVDAAGNVSAETSIQVVTTNPADTTPPGAPPSFRATATTTTSVTLAWNASTDAGGVARYEVSQNSTTVFVSVGNLLTKQMTGLAPSTSYTFRVRAVDNAGNISAVSQITVSTSAPTTGGTVTTLMGTSWNSVSQYGTWDSWRVYDLNTPSSAVAKGAKIVAVTDDPATNNATSGQAGATLLRNALMTFYGRTGTPSKNATIQFHWANRNEVDAASENITNLTAFADTYELMEAVIADFPMAQLWFDATRNGLAANRTQPLLNATATSGRKVYQMLDGLAGSYYPPAVFGYPNISAATFVQSGITGPIDLYMAAHAQFGIKKAAIWEWGQARGWNPPATGATYRDDAIRRDFTKQFIAAWFQACLNNGVEPVLATYWDRDGSAGGAGGADVRFSLDQSLVTPNTATVWHDAVTTFNAR